jgi:hypothetical protein
MSNRLPPAVIINTILEIGDLNTTTAEHIKNSVPKKDGFDAPAYKISISYANLPFIERIEGILKIFDD